MGQKLNFFPFDTRFVGPKPQTEADPKWVKTLEASGALGIFEKVDGYQTVVPISDRVQILSRTCNEWTGRFPHIEDELRGLNIPPETLVIGEMSAKLDGRNDPDHFGRFVKSGVQKSLLLQKDFDPVRLTIFNILVYKGRDVSHLPFRERLRLLEKIVGKKCKYISVIKPIRKTFAAAKRHAQKLKWEGLVLYDMGAGTEFSIDGKSSLPPRPAGCAKWKPDPEDDFVAIGYRVSTSDTYAGLVRDLNIIQYDPVSKQPINCGYVGVGINKANKKRLLDTSLYPFVLQARFECRTKRHKLKKARILRLERDDKRPEECIHPYAVAA